MAEKTDVYRELRTIALADGTLVALLGAATAFYYGEDLALRPEEPFIYMKEADDSPMMSDSFWGDFRPRLEMHVCGANPAVLHQIVERLDALFIIPFKRAAVIESSTFVIRQMMRRNALLLPMAQREEGDRGFQQIVCEWELKLTAKS